MLDEKNMDILKELGDQRIIDIVEKYVKLLKPSKVTVLKGTDEDLQYVRDLALSNAEESTLATKGHTLHFDGISDQGRDKANTKILVPKGQKISKHINTDDREECLTEVFEQMDGIMKGKEMLVSFFCLGPNDSNFSIPALQITDSAYVLHSENILYRQGYEEFKNLKGGLFFHFIHSAGQLEGNVTKNVDKRRIYIDLDADRVFTVNNQYAGNSVGLKKLALRLAIKKSHEEEWLCEHMLVMGAKQKGRTTYFAGAFPSACGKTSTAMIPGQSIIGDDIAYLKPGEDGRMYAANVEQGIFGIIENVNAKDDPLIYETLTTPRELIFSNVLDSEGTPYWLGMGKEFPARGKSYFGDWTKGSVDADGKEIKPAHKNARYTVRLEELENVDPNLHNPKGVPISGIVYGGRDSDTNPPVLESFSWSHGVFIGAALESETTAATLGTAGVRKHNPMANLDFLVIPLGTYVKNHLKFGEALDNAPKIFATNYFLKKDGKFLNSIVDKKVWLMWMEGRVHEEFGAIETPIGMIPKYDDLKVLFKDIFKKDYSREDYMEQFSIRISHLLERLDRIEDLYKEEQDVPEVFEGHIDSQRKRLLKAQDKYGSEVISPFDFG